MKNMLLISGLCFSGFVFSLGFSRNDPVPNNIIWNYEGYNDEEAMKTFRSFLKTSNKFIFIDEENKDKNVSVIVCKLTDDKEPLGAIIFINIDTAIKNSKMKDAITITMVTSLKKGTNRGIALEMVNQLNAQNRLRSGGFRWMVSTPKPFQEESIYFSCSKDFEYIDSVELKEFENWVDLQSRTAFALISNLPVEVKPIIDSGFIVPFQDTKEKNNKIFK